MTFSKSVQGVIRQYGQPVTLFDQQGQELSQGWAFVQPVTTENKDYLWQDLSPLGTYDGAHFRFLGEAALMEENHSAAWLRCLDQQLSVQEMQPVYLGEQLLYWWGILTIRAEEEVCP